MISVLVVDDSVVVRRLVADALSADRGVEVVGTAPNGRVALAKLDQLAPDLVTLDIEMPVMDGLTTLRQLRRTHPKLPVIMFSTLTRAGATATLDALAAGASDYVTKPANVGSVAESLASVRDQLLPRIHALCDRPAVPKPPAMPVPTRDRADAQRRSGRPPPGAGGVDVIAVGCSTGGPDALTRMLTMLPAGLPVPVVVVQHMPPVFTAMFAERLNRMTALTVVEAVDGTTLRPGTVYIAPGNQHLTVVRQGTAVVTRLHGGPPENYCRPAVDVLFRSVATAFGGAAVGVVLTGMGQDGARGCRLLHAAGAEIVVQDEASSVVWGMPGAVVGGGVADAVLTVDQIAAHLAQRTARGVAGAFARARP